jgi:N-acetylneuraminic acid mutarotase
MIMGRILAGAVFVQNQLFVVGGYNAGGPTTRSETYSGGIWFSLPSMNFPRAGAAVAAVGNRIYALSGNSDPALVGNIDGNIDLAPPGPAFNETGEYFDLNTGKWVLIESQAPVGFYGAATAVIGSRIYIYGGLTRDPNYNFSSLVFDTDTLTWDYMQAPGSDRVWCGGAGIGGKAYVFGGIRYRRLQTIGAISEYPPSANAWWPVPQFVSPARALMATAVFGDSVFLFGGSTVFTAAPVFGTVEQFQPFGSTYYLLKKS